MRERSVFIFPAQLKTGNTALCCAVSQHFKQSTLFGMVMCSGAAQESCM